MKDKKIRLQDDPDLVTPKTVTVFAGPNGEVMVDAYLADEKVARYHHATHRKCKEHNEIHEKHQKCPRCDEAYLDERWGKMFSVRADAPSWSGHAFIYDGDEFFWSEDDIHEFCYEHEIELSKIRLVEAVPHVCPEVDPVNIMEDYLPSDDDSGSIPEEIVEAVDALNVAIKNAGPLTWVPGKRKVVL